MDEHIYVNGAVHVNNKSKKMNIKKINYFLLFYPIPSFFSIDFFFVKIRTEF